MLCYSGDNPNRDLDAMGCGVADAFVAWRAESGRSRFSA
jgi:hypothetical protein